MGELFGWLIVLGIVLGAMVVVSVLIAILVALFREPGPSQYERLQQNGIHVVGTILRSGSGLCQDADNEGIEVTVRFCSREGKEYLLKDLHCFHWYADEESRNHLQAGTDVNIWYDPENAKNLILQYGTLWRDGTAPCVMFLSGFDD